MIGDVKQGGTMEYGESILDSIHPDEGLEDFEDIEMLDVEEGEFVEGRNSHIDLCQSNKGNAREINPVPISTNRKPRNKKKKKKNRKKKGIQGSGVTDINRFVLDVCRLLKERKSYLVYAAVGSLGISALSDLVQEVAAIQACGGQKTADGLRFRTGGGILWNILKTREPNAYREIMKKGKEFEVTTMITTIALIALSSVLVESRITTEEFKTTFKPSMSNGKVEGTRWAVLVAGSYGYWNYRHQANVCHAYQLLRRGGLKDENIIVFMFDDIAFNEENPRPGVIINRPYGSDVYNGVPKDYTGEDASVDNLFAVILGNKTALKGGSGKVLNSGPNDHIFIYYGDHGGPGILMMPTDEELYAHDLINVLKKKHSSGTYKSMAIYVEACESGSMFDGLLPKGLNIYATTAANPNESSYGYYCPGMYPPPPEVYNTCLGDLYSISWLEDSDLSNLRDETLRKQYQVVKRRTGYSSSSSSHVMQYGDINISKDKLFIYMGANPDNENNTSLGYRSTSPTTHPQAVNQRDASILYLNEKLRAAPEGTEKWVKSWNDFSKEMAHRSHVDRSVQAIGELVIGAKNAAEVMRAVRPQGQPLVDDWDCLKTLVDIYKHHCGSLSRYGIKHMRAFANMCNAGVGKDQMAWAAAKACT